MAPFTMDPAAEAALAEQASEWFVRMRGPDAGRARPAFEAWLAEHPNHRIMYDRIALRWDQSGLVGHTPSGQARAGLPPAPVATPARLWRYAIAAGIALLVGFGVVLQQHASAPATADIAITSDTGIRRVRLGDGSMVTLDADTRIVLRFSGVERRLELARGRARFEVAHAAQRPFVVIADGREVVATGTVFDVSLRDGAMSVALLRGGVDVRAGHRSPVVAARLAPGQSVELLPRVAAAPVRSTNAGSLAWPTGMIEFDGTPLGEVVATANRYSARKIVLASPALASLAVTGGFRMGNQDSIAASLAAAFDLAVERQQDGSILLR